MWRAVLQPVPASCACSVVLVVHSVVVAAVLRLPSLFKTRLLAVTTPVQLAGLYCDANDSTPLVATEVWENENAVVTVWIAFEMLAKADASEDTISPALPAGK